MEILPTEKYNRDVVRGRLTELIDEKYREFHSGLLPGTDTILGVRLPELRKLAKEIAKEDFEGYLFEVRELKPETSGVSYEECMLEGLVIGYGKMPLEKKLAYLDVFVPKIGNWAVCDCCCSTYKFMEKYPEESWEYIQTYIKSEKEFEIRFALVCMLDYFIKEDYLDRILACCNEIHHEGYYVKMAAAWLLSVCYVKFPERTEQFLQNNELDDFTQNKSIQKIRESYRVAKADKERLNSLKRGKR